MFKGVFRLSIVLSILAWGAFAVFLRQDSIDILQRYVYPHLSPVWTSEGPNERHWCYVTATPSFLELPKNERIDFASTFFEKEIAGLAEENYMDVDSFRSDFLNSATLTLKQAPIRRQLVGIYEGNLYREFGHGAWHTRSKLWKIAVDALMLSVISSTIFFAVVTGLFVTIRWVTRGFTN